MNTKSEWSNKYGTFEVQESEKTVLESPATQPKSSYEQYSYTLTTVAFFVIWWTLAAFYNVDNKKAIQATPAPFTIATLQGVVGCVMFLPLWLLNLRTPPSFNSWHIFFTKMVPQGLFHGMCHAGGVASMGAGAVSFTQIIKACEPVTTSIFTIFILKYIFSIWTNVTLIPIVGGVSLASLGSTEFRWYAFSMAMMSNVGASLRAVYAKKTMTNPKAIGSNLNSANIFSVLTLILTVTFIPMCLCIEGLALYNRWGEGAGLFNPPATNFTIVRWILQSGVWHYVYNEASFRALARVNQLSHAVGNTMKRVISLVYAVLMLNEHISFRGYLGCTIAIIGTFLFSLAKNKFG